MLIRGRGDLLAADLRSGRQSEACGACAVST